jgi:hypothetical protein
MGVFIQTTGSVTFIRLPSSLYQRERTPTAAPAGSKDVEVEGCALDCPFVCPFVCAFTTTGMATIGNAMAAAKRLDSGCSRGFIKRKVLYPRPFSSTNA